MPSSIKISTISVISLDERQFAQKKGGKKSQHGILGCRTLLEYIILYIRSIQTKLFPQSYHYSEKLKTMSNLFLHYIGILSNDSFIVGSLDSVSITATKLQ